MNRLYSVRPDLYYGIQEDLRINPFYNDSDMWDALVFIHDNWGIPVQSPKKKV